MGSLHALTLWPVEIHRGEDGHKFFFHITGLSGTKLTELAGNQVDFSAVAHQSGDRPGENLRAFYVQLGSEEALAIATEPNLDDALLVCSANQTNLAEIHDLHVSSGFQQCSLA
jgi:hypothetical protein